MLESNCRRQAAGAIVSRVGELSPPWRRIPIILQLTRTECGLACLAMILNHHGRKVELSELREHFGSGRDGASALAISQAARAYGLRAKAYSLKPADLKQLTFPAIVHWNFDHFVVVECWSPHHVQIIDPAAGRLRLTAAEFDAGFTGGRFDLRPGAAIRAPAPAQNLERAGGSPIESMMFSHR
jgi:ABC-type bacteriocin/lantibiotic exporter with double-glycine peptidase domain